MHVRSVNQSEFRLTLEVAMRLANEVMDDVLDSRTALTEVGFTKAPDASEASMTRLDRRFVELLPLLQELPDLTTDEAVARVNEELASLPIAPSVVDHHGVGPHFHWTPASATFDTQVMADILMALAYELCEDGVSRFGRCAAEGCDRLYYDSTRNRSRRFCSDARCASRTHTADHRARQRKG